MVERPWHKFYDKWVPKSLSYPERLIHQLLDESADKYPEKPLALFFGREFTYAQIKEMSNSLAASLKELGMKKGDKVALVMPNYPGFIVAYYAVLKAGGVVVPLNPLYTVEELSNQIGDSECVGIITIPMFAEKVSKIVEEKGLRFFMVSKIADFLPLKLSLPMKLKEWWQLSKVKVSYHLMNPLLKKKTDFSPGKTSPSEAGVIIYSGGTTGVAKGIVLSHKAVCANALQIATWGDLNSEERLLAVLPFFHGYGMNVCMNAPILAGASIVLLPRFSPQLMAEHIHRYRPTMTAVVPTILVALMNTPGLEKYNLSSLKAVWVGAAPLTKAVKEGFEKKTGCRVIEGYGLTEAVTAIMANPYKGAHKVGSIGIPFPDVDARVVSLEDGKDLPPNQQGEIVLKSPTLMLGYYRKEKETREVLKDGWLYTGDIGYMDEDGYFYITDRKKDLIIVGGFNVFPREIEEVLYKHPKVKEGVAVGVPDPYKGERIKVFVVLKEGEEATEEELIEHFKKHLAPYKVPSEIEFRSSLPKSAIGKILRRILREEELKKANQAP